MQRENGSWLIDGTFAIGEFKRRFDIDELPNEERAAFQTLAGYVLSELGRLPRTGDSCTWNGLRFEVVDMDGNRIDKVLVEKVEGA